MKFGLLIAIERELKAFLEEYGSSLATEQACGRTVYHARIGEHEVYALCSGCGEIDAAAGTQLLIARYGCQAMLNFGVAGALDPALRVEDLFLVSKVRHYDFDISDIDPVRPHQYSEFPDEFMPLDAELIARARAVFPSIRETAVASGDKFVADQSVKRELFSLGCQICEMEIAGIARTCFLNGIPCLSVKCISDTYDGGAGDFAANVAAGAQKAFSVLQGILLSPQVEKR